MKSTPFTAALGAAALLFTVSVASAQISINSGSLGAAGDGTYTSTPGTFTLGLPSPIFAEAPNAVGYTGGGRTLVPFIPALNPAASSPFSIEFWANPSSFDNDDAMISNRYATGNRSGWVIYQRGNDPVGTNNGWNFRMYNGAGSGVGWELQGGFAPLNAWSHVVATWSGTAALLYVNGVLVDDTNSGTGVYNANLASNAPPFSIGALADGSSSSTAVVDEVAFYGSVLTPGQIANHYALASSPTAGAYSSAVTGDGAIEYLANVPEPASLGLLALGSIFMLGRRRRA